MEVSIRKFSHLDAPEFHEAVVESAEHLSYWLPWCTPDYALKDAEDWCSSASTVWQAGTDYRFLIENQVSKEILGSVGFNQIVKNHRIGNLGYWVRKSALNKGVCSQAVFGVQNQRNYEVLGMPSIIMVKNSTRF